MVIFDYQKENDEMWCALSIRIPDAWGNKIVRTLSSVFESFGRTLLRLFVGCELRQEELCGARVHERAAD